MMCVVLAVFCFDTQMACLYYGAHIYMLEISDVLP